MIIYKNAGYKVKIYDYPTMHAAGGKCISGNLISKNCFSENHW